MVSPAAAKHSPFRAANEVHDATFTIGAETGGTTKNVAVQLKDARGKALQRSVGLKFYLSSQADGSVIGAAPSSGIAIGTDGLLIEHTNNVAGVVVSESDGQFDINLVEAGALTTYLVLIMPDGRLVISSAITHAA